MGVVAYLEKASWWVIGLWVFGMYVVALAYDGRLVGGARKLVGLTRFHEQIRIKRSSSVMGVKDEQNEETLSY